MIFKKFVLPGRPDRVFEPTETDLLWLARSAWGEAGENASSQAYAAVLWCEVSRWLRWGVDHPWATFLEFLQKFSKPIDPGRADLPRPAAIQGATWEEIPDRAKNAALLFVYGKLKNPVPDAVDFGAQDATPLTARERGVVVGGNEFLTPSQTSLSWLPGRVEVARGSTALCFRGVCAYRSDTRVHRCGRCG